MISEVISFALEEGCLLILAVVAYLIASGAFKARGGTKAQASSLKSFSPQKHGDVKSGAHQSITRAARYGSADQAIAAVPRHKSESARSDLVRHAKAIRTYGKEGDLKSAISLFDTHKGHANSLLYNCILEACVSCSDLQKTLCYFQEAKEHGLADTVTYNTVMKGQLASGDAQSAHRLLDEMK